MHVSAASLLVLLGCVACAPAQSFDEPIPADDPWERVEPSAEDLAKFEAAAAYLEGERGLALIVMEGDAVLFETYLNGHSNETPNPFWSGTKTIGGCVLPQLAARDGLLSLDERVADTITEWEGVEGKQDMEVQHLLHFTSGLEGDNAIFRRDAFRAPEDQRRPDKYALAVEQPMSGAPGAQWVYDPIHLWVFGAVMARKLGGSPLDYLDAEIFEPIGLRRSGWNLDVEGNPALAFGLWTSAPELTKLGNLLLHDGVYQGERLLPEGTLGACMQGTDVNPAYGLGAWLNEPMGEGLSFPEGGMNEGGPILMEGGPDVLVAGGYGGQRIYVVPEWDRVYITQGDNSKMEDPVLFDLLVNGPG
ncbi:MAG: beta-lactamase family protein [Alphaproteobacteria bacterium]|nr:beta-lactamase family protein [Alphaproteobacteria bacterium]